MSNHDWIPSAPGIPREGWSDAYWDELWERTCDRNAGLLLKNVHVKEWTRAELEALARAVCHAEE